jgi:hypothetical protein
VLQRIRLASAVFLRGEFAAPWAFASTDAATLCQIGNRRRALRISHRVHIAVRQHDGVARLGDRVLATLELRKLPSTATWKSTSVRAPG